MTESPLADTHRLSSEAIDALFAAAGSGAHEDELLSVVTICESLNRRLDQLTVSVTAELSRRGTFTERGYRTAAGALSDLVGWDRFESRRRVTAAEQVCPRIGLDGTVLPARLAATAAVFAAGGCGLRHVEVIAKVLGTPAAGRISPEAWAGVEAELADKAPLYTPHDLQAHGTALVELLDQDGPEPDDRGPDPVNELHLNRRSDGNGGTLKGTFEDASLFDAIAALLDAKSKPLTGDDDRSTAQRQADALAEVCGYVLDHGDIAECGGRRPHLNVLVRLEDLQSRCRSALLDFGGTLSPETLRMLACDCAVVPIVMNGAGQPLDVGRATRTIPDASAEPSLPATSAAPTPAATGPRRGARSITSRPGTTTARRSCATA